MKISLNWINDYVEIGHDARALAQILMDRGFPCEGIEQVGDDWVLDVEVTSNRGDCLGHIGIARELASAAGKPLRIPEVSYPESKHEASQQVSVEIAEPDLCGRYTARVVEGVKVGPSPDWMRTRLEAVGMRSVSNVVDATNYAMLESGQPPHAFDYAKIAQGRIVVRKARPGESLVSIDGTRCVCGPDMLVITDPTGPVAVAGVMGGLATEVDDRTTTILLEEAHFDPVCIRTTSRRLALPSEAAYRFGRIVDIEQIDWASRRTAQLIVRVSGGAVARGVVDVYPRPRAGVVVTLRPARIRTLLGIEVPRARVLAILESLGFRPRSEGDRLICTVPSWRSDVTREVDLIEEVARCFGYDQVPTRDAIQIRATARDSRQGMLESAGRFLNACGYFETVSVDLIDKNLADLFAEVEGSPFLAVRDTACKGGGLLRRTLLGSLMTVLKTNVYAKNLPCRVFEIAATFVPRGVAGQLPVERTCLGLVADGDFRQVRAAVEGTILSLVPGAEVQFVPTTLAWAEVGAEVRVQGRTVGLAGVFSERVNQTIDLKHLSPVGAEIDLDALMGMPRGEVRFRPIPRFPAIERDLSIVVPDSVVWSQIVASVRGRAPVELEEIRFVEVYRGKGIPEGRKSLTLSLRFRDQDGTLQHETVDGFQSAILKALADAVGAELRTI
ncbi:MAG: phenylalanine--tRNA ligase subunit beta [Phycisphaerae bacterium]|nr:phenylalanine--tRNA ligase subunit beta [Phycisphaerae bacterium]